jgi:uncharacterized protein YaaR (DUF327 family)
MSEEVELKVYLSDLDAVIPFIKSITLYDIFDKLAEQKCKVLAEPTLENLLQYKRISDEFVQINNNQINLMDAYIETLFARSVGKAKPVEDMYKEVEDLSKPQYFDRDNGTWEE